VDDPLLAAYYNENNRRNPSELKKPHTNRGRADLLLKKDNKILQQSLNNNSSIADDSVRGNSPLNKTQPEFKFKGSKQNSPETKIMIKEEIFRPQ
jgi:hypothetical protein